MDIKGLAGQLVKKCLKKGADAAEVYVESGRNLSLDVRKGDIETVQEAAASGAGIRVFVKGRMAFASSNDLGEKALEDAVGRAIEFARVTTPDPNNVLPDDPGTTAVAGLYDPRIAQVPMEEKIELAKRLEKLALKDPRITKSDGASYRESESEIVIANSSGLLKSYRSSGCGYGVSVVAEKGEQKASGGDSCSRRFYADLKPAEEVAAKAAREAYETLDPRPVKTQRAAVIFHADVSRALLGGILGAVDGERVLQGASFLAKKMDQKIGSEMITIVDDGTREKGMASEPFDGEGVPTQKTDDRRQGRPEGLPLQHQRGQARRGPEHGQRLAGRLRRPAGDRAAQLFHGGRLGQAGGHHRGHQDGAPGQRRHGLRDQSGQRQLQRRRVRILGRERQDRLSRAAA